MSETTQPGVHERWAHFRFGVVGGLLAAPPPRRQLRAELERLAARTWEHPVSGEPTQFAFSTIERWLPGGAQRAPGSGSGAAAQDPQGRWTAEFDGSRAAASGAGSVSSAPSWSVQLHYDNLVTLAESRRQLRPVPAYWTVRSFEAEYVGGLWHWDYHHGSRKVETAQGEWVRPLLFGVLDDRSRLACHLQWYLGETDENTAHGLMQAFAKRGLPRAAMSDNGGAMTADEIVEGLTRLGIVHETTLPYSPYQKRQAGGLRHALSKAGAAPLMTPELCATLCDHAAGNYRTLFNMAGELLAIAAHRDLDRINENLFLETFAAPPSDASGAGRWR